MPLASPAFFVSCLAAFTVSFFLRAVQVLIIESILFRFSFCIRFLLLVFLRSFAYRTYALIPFGKVYADIVLFRDSVLTPDSCFRSGLAVILFYVGTTVGSFGILLQRVLPARLTPPGKIPCAEPFRYCLKLF